jgi:hypothetical protein
MVSPPQDFITAPWIVQHGVHEESLHDPEGSTVQVVAPDPPAHTQINMPKTANRLRLILELLAFTISGISK